MTAHPAAGAAPHIPLDESYPEIRDLVRRICADFPGSYWRKLDEASAYPTDFVKALTDGGLLAQLIPEEFGGSGQPLSTARRTGLRTAVDHQADEQQDGHHDGGHERCHREATLVLAHRQPPGILHCGHSRTVSSAVLHKASVLDSG